MTKLSIVGAGPGSAIYVTPAARLIVQNADIVIGASRCLELFQKEITGEKIILNAKNLDLTLQYATDSVLKEKNVVLLSTGDPGFSGLLQTLKRKRIMENITFEVVPGISVVQVCAARLGLCWDDIRLLSFHEGVSNEKKSYLLKVIAAGETVMLLPDPKAFTPRDISNFLIQNGLAPSDSVIICENLTLSDERIRKTTLEEALKLEFASLSVMVIISKLKTVKREN